MIQHEPGNALILAHAGPFPYHVERPIKAHLPLDNEHTIGRHRMVENEYSDESAFVKRARAFLLDAPPIC